MASDRNWSNVLAGASQLPKDWLDTAERWHRHFLLKAIPAILLTLVAGVGLNAAGWKEINFLFALSAILGGLFFATQPKVVLTVFGVGTLWNGLLDSQVKGAKANLDQGLQFVSDKYVRPVGHVLLLATVVFVFLGTYRIQNPLAMLPLIAVVMGLGLWAALFAADTTWYRRITLKILLAAGVMSLIGAYFYTPSRTEKTIEQIEKAQEANRERLIDEGLTPILRKAEHGVKLTERETEILQAAKAREESRSIAKKAKEIFLGMVIEYQVPSNIAPENLKQICGIPPGEYEFDLAGDPHLTLVVNDPESGMSRTTLNIADWSKAGRGGVSYPEYIPGGALLNDVPMRSKVVIGKNGCARIRFNWPESEIDYFRNGIFKIESTTLRILLK